MLAELAAALSIGLLQCRSFFHREGISDFGVLNGTDLCADVRMHRTSIRMACVPMKSMQRYLLELGPRKAKERSNPSSICNPGGPLVIDGRSGLRVAEH